MNKIATLKKEEANSKCEKCDCLVNTLFCNLDSKELEDIDSSKIIRTIDKGQIIFFEGDSVKGIHCLKNGKVKLYKTLNDGGMQILKISQCGDLIGYRGLLGNGRYIATAETIEETEICFIPENKIMHAIKNSLPFSLALMARLASEISDVEEKSVTLMQKSSKERLAQALVQMHTSFGTDTLGFIQIVLTRIELGAYTGLASETIIRTLSSWEEQGILLLYKKKIKVLDIDKLIAISNSEDN